MQRVTMTTMAIMKGNEKTFVYARHHSKYFTCIDSFKGQSNNPLT